MDSARARGIGARCLTRGGLAFFNRWSGSNKRRRRLHVVGQRDCRYHVGAALAHASGVALRPTTRARGQLRRLRLFPSGQNYRKTLAIISGIGRTEFPELAPSIGILAVVMTNDRSVAIRQTPRGTAPREGRIGCVGHHLSQLRSDLARPRMNQVRCATYAAGVMVAMATNVLDGLQRGLTSRSVVSAKEFSRRYS